MDDILSLLQQVEQGSLSAKEAALQLKMQPFEDLGYAKVDHHRALRQHAKEVIYGEGKTTSQLEGILRSMLELSLIHI